MLGGQDAVLDEAHLQPHSAQGPPDRGQIAGEGAVRAYAQVRTAKRGRWERR